MARTLSRPRLLRWNANPVTDHNRSPLNIEVERIEKSQRTANGTMRKYVIADKRTFAVSWDMLPNTAANTVDGFWGASEIESFYNNNTGAFSLEVTDGAGVAKTYNVMFSSFSKEITKRGVIDFWHISLQMVEV